MKRKFTKEQLIQSIQNFYNSQGRAPFNGDCLTNGLASNNVYQRYFGTWKNALIESGIPFKIFHKPILIKCTQCFKEHLKGIGEMNEKRRKSTNFFCSSSCAATYNNKHKKYGIRCSKFEIAVQSLLREEFPELIFDFNQKNAVGSELDIFCPTLKLAFEINGIFHYKPIFGEDTFKKIINNDLQKAISCKNNNIELMIINISDCKYLTKQQISKYYQYIKERIELKLRHQ